MTRILFILLIFFSISSSAQKIRFTNNTNQWTTLSINGDDCSFLNNYLYRADTIVHGRTYKSMYSTWTIYTGYHGTCYCGYYESGVEINCFIREDTLAGMVYYFNPTDTAEHILYNYNLQVGDSISYGSLTDTVASIDSTLFNGVYYRIYNMQNTVYGWARSYTVLEGVGCTNDPFFPAWFGECFEFGESLTCFYENDSCPIISAPINSCAQYGIWCCPLNTTVFNNAAGCGSASLNLANNINQEIPYLAIYPNPATDQITIACTNEITTLQVTNILGQIVYDNGYNSQKIEVDVADLAKGMYFVKVNGCEVRKFVKE